MVCDASAGNVIPTPELSSSEQWLKTLDLQAFETDIKAVGIALAKKQGEEDVKHLNKIILWNRLFALVGFSTVWMAPNPLTVFCVSTAIFSSWTMLGHHVCHGMFVALLLLLSLIYLDYLLIVVVAFRRIRQDHCS